MTQSILSAKPGDIPTLYIVRHGSTDWNSDEKGGERFRGTSSIDLNGEGVKEAEAAGRQLSGKGLQAVFTDNLVRSVHSGKIIAEATGATHEIRKELRQWELGDLTGTKVRDGLESLKSYSEKTPDKPLPQKNGKGQSFNAWRETYLTAFDHVLDETQSRGPNAIVVHAVDFQLIRASYDSPGGFSNHNVTMDVFAAFHQGLKTGAMATIEYRHRKWELVLPKGALQSKDGE